jgi:2-alkyl-3-oxoalkanoate reductase
VPCAPPSKAKTLSIHVAAWLGPRHGGDDMAWPVNVYATLQLVQMAAAAGVRRFVHVSSIAAYGPTKAEVVTEERPVDPRQAAVYGRTKAEGELQARRLARELGMELVVARPGMVYGPASRAWTVRMVKLVQQRAPVIFGKGEGYAYPIYIDNLVDGLMLAGTVPVAASEDFNFVDEPRTWREWFGAYGEMSGREPVAVPLWLGRLALRGAEWLPLGLSVNRDLEDYYRAKTVFPHEKASRFLGYEPAVSFEEGMARAGAWLRANGHLA